MKADMTLEPQKMMDDSLLINFRNGRIESKSIN